MLFSPIFYVFIYIKCAFALFDHHFFNSSLFLYLFEFIVTTKTIRHTNSPKSMYNKYVSCARAFRFERNLLKIKNWCVFLNTVSFKSAHQP